MTAIIKHGIALLEKGGRHHLQLKGKSLTDSLPLMKEFDKPILDIRINGRGKEGSAYGVKLYTAGNPDPDLAVFGKIDYREKSPILQIRGDYFYGQDYASGRVIIRTGEKGSFFNNLSESNGETLSLKANSKALQAEINANKNALTNLTILLNKLGLNFDLEKELLKIFTGINDNNNLAIKLKELNPFSAKPQHKLDIKPQRIIEPIKTTDSGEIKINPHEYFKEDAPAKEADPLTQINKTIEQQNSTQNIKHKIQEETMQINILKGRLTQAQKDFQEAKAGSDSISKASLINMIKEDLAKAERTLEFHQKRLAELQKK